MTRYTTRVGCYTWWTCHTIFLPFVLIITLSYMLVEFIVDQRRAWRKRAEERKWNRYPQYPNGTLITGRLTKSELAAATQATTSLSPCNAQGGPVPFLPPEIIREIVRHATDTFPAPSSIHYPGPSASQSLPPPPPHPRFPYSGFSLGEDIEDDRKLQALSMKIKLSVSRISRAWQNVAVEFLFASIRIHNWGQISLLWRAFEADAKRRGEQASKESVARPGSAPWWIRELWIDFEMTKLVAQPDPTDFRLSDLLKICPNIIKFRGLGSWKLFHAPLRWKDIAVLKQLLHLPDEWVDKTHTEPHEVQGTEAQSGVHEVQDSHFDAPDTGRRVELCFALNWDPPLQLPSDSPIATRRTLNLPSISSMELRSLNVFMNGRWAVHDTIRLPNLVHLSLRGANSLTYATTNLVLPSIRSVTLGLNILNSLGFLAVSQLESFLEKHGFALEELTILETPYTSFLQGLDRLCPVLHTIRTHYLQLPTSVISSVRTVGLYGLEDAAGNSESGEGLILSIFKVFPEVTAIQDLSWRSGMIRRRAYTNWTDPEGAKHREFWAQVLRTIRRGSGCSQPTGGDEQLSVQEVELLDWRGKQVEAVPTKPPEGQSAILSPDDRLLDALVSKARSLI